MKDLQVDDLTTGLRQLADTDSASSSEYDPNLRTIMVDDPSTGRRPAKTIADLFSYRGSHSHMMVDSLTLGRIPLESVEVSTAWSPSALFASSEVGVWYDPSDLSTMFQNSNGTTAVAVGDPVGYIADKSGNGFHATQATAASRPVLRESGGLYYLEFDGSDDGMATAAIDFTATDKMSVFVGVRKLSDVGTGMIVELGASGPFSCYNYSADASYKLMGLSSAAISAPITNVIAGNNNGATAILDINGTQVASGASDLVGNYANAPLYICRRGGVSLPFNGHLYSLIVRGALSSEDEITAAETYVNSKTGAY